MENEFQQMIAGEKPVLADFSAEWCGPCKMMPPILKEIKQQLGDSVRVIKIDIDKSPKTAASFQIQSVPTLVLFKNGQPVWRQSGVMPASQVLAGIRNKL